MQPVPEGYEALDFIGFTDRGIYSSSETYIKNDIVHKDNTAWLCLVDNTTGITPAEGANWTLFMDSTTPFYGAYDTFPAVGEPGRFYIDDTVDPRLMYTWDSETQKYILTGGAGGADGGSVDIPITLTSAGWTGTAAPYQQTITVPQMREGMTPLYFLASDGDAAQYAFSLITGYQAGYAEITFYAADKPTVDIDLTLKGIPAQEMEYVDNTVVFLVEPSAFALNSTTQRYEATITVEGMTAGTGGTWDIVRSGPVLTEAESKIALSITDVDRLDGAVKISCLEVPAQRYMMSIAGAYPDAEPGTVILAGMQEWFDRVEALEEKAKISNYGIIDIFDWDDSKIENVQGNAIVCGNVISIFMAFKVVGSVSAGFGTLKQKYKPKNNYAILPFFSYENPYSPISGSLWFYGSNGTAMLYGASIEKSYYIYGSWII